MGQFPRVSLGQMQKNITRSVMKEENVPTGVCLEERIESKLLREMGKQVKLRMSCLITLRCPERPPS